MECQSLTFHNDLAETSLSNKSKTWVRTTTEILIPPKSECLIPAMVPPEFRAGLAIIEPSIKLHKLQLALAKFVVFPINNRTVCKVMNPTGVARQGRRWKFVAGGSKVRESGGGPPVGSRGKAPVGVWGTSPRS